MQDRKKSRTDPVRRKMFFQTVDIYCYVRALHQTYGKNRNYGIVSTVFESMYFTFIPLDNMLKIYIIFLFSDKILFEIGIDILTAISLVVNLLLEPEYTVEN